MAIVHSGYVRDNEGNAIACATAQRVTTDTCTAVGSAVLSNACGYWTTTTCTQGLYDVTITSGSNKRRLQYKDEVQLKTIETATLKIRNPGDTFTYDIVPGAIVSADQTLNLPVISSSDTLAVLGIAQTWSAIQTHSADIIVQDASDVALGSGSDALLRWSTGDADNHALVLALGQSNQVLHITEACDVAVDWNVSANAADSEVWIHSSTSAATDYLVLGRHTGTIATIDVQGGTTLNLDIAGNTELTVTASGLNLPANSDINFTGTTGTNDIVLTNALADALSITDGSADIVVVDTSTSGNVITFSSALTVGVSDTGHDVQFFGATANTYMLWDENTDDLVLTLGAELYFYDAAGGEHIKSDGTDMTIYAGADLNLTAGTDINIPTCVGLTFGNDGEKIEGDGTDLTVSGNILKLTPAASINVTAAVPVYINDTANGNMTTGLTINQGAADNEILAFKSSDVDHPFTGTGKAENDTYAAFQKHVATGGLLVRSFLETGSRSLVLLGVGSTQNTDKNVCAGGMVEIQAGKTDGSDSYEALGAEGNMLVIRDVAGVSRFVFDIEGDGYADVNWHTYATHDDLGLVVDMEQELLLHEDVAKTERRHMLEEVGIIGKNSWHMENGKPKAMVNMTRLSMLHHGALIQVSERMEALETNLLALQEAN